MPRDIDEGVGCEREVGCMEQRRLEEACGMTPTAVLREGEEGEDAGAARVTEEEESGGQDLIYV